MSDKIKAYQEALRRKQRAAQCIQILKQRASNSCLAVVNTAQARDYYLLELDSWPDKSEVVATVREAADAAMAAQAAFEAIPEEERLGVQGPSEFYDE